MMWAAPFQGALSISDGAAPNPGPGGGLNTQGPGPGPLHLQVR